MSSTTLKGINNIGDPQLSEVIRDNLITFIDWGLLNKGSFFNITIPTSGAYGGDRHILHSVDDPRYTDGQVWEAYRQNWVWESGLSTTTQPIAISGVFVDGTFQPTSGNTFTIDYPNGRIVFNSAISTNSTVQLEYSHKWVKVLAANDLDWFQQPNTRSFRVDEEANSKLSSTKLDLPAIAVEVTDDRTYEGYQLGQGQYVYTDVVFHIISEDNTMMYRLADVLANQNEKTIYLFDTARLARNDAFPLKYDGSKNTNPLTYPDLVAPSADGGYRYTSDVTNGKMRIFNTTAGSQQSIAPKLYHSTVRWTTEVTLHKI